MKIHISKQSGSALVVTLCSIGIIGLALAAHLDMTATQNRSVARSEAWNSALVMAETGIEEAIQALYVNSTSAAALTGQGWSSNNTVFTLSRNISGGRYDMVISNVSPPVIYSTGYRTTPLGTNEVSRTVRALTAQSSMWGKGLVAKGNISIGVGNVDSFDSGGVTNYSAGIKKAGGDVTSLTAGVSVGSNGEVLGKVTVSSGQTISSSGHIGDIGGTGNQAGYLLYNASGTMPTPTLPSGVGPSLGTSVNVSSGRTFSGSTASGNYYSSGGGLGGTIIVTNGAKVVLYVSASFTLAGQDAIKIYPNSSLTIYMAGETAALGGNGIMNSSGNALNFSFIGLPANHSISVSGNGQFVGTIWAPSASLTLNGAGQAGAFIGAAMVNDCDFHGNGTVFHYDENLGRNGPGNGFVISGWDEL